MSAAHCSRLRNGCLLNRKLVGLMTETQAIRFRPQICTTRLTCSTRPEAMLDIWIPREQHQPKPSSSYLMCSSSTAPRTSVGRIFRSFVCHLNSFNRTSEANETNVSVQKASPTDCSSDMEDVAWKNLRITHNVAQIADNAYIHTIHLVRQFAMRFDANKQVDCMLNE